MRKLLLPAVLAGLVGIVGIVAAQTTPGSPNPTPRMRGATTFGGSGSYLISSSANDHANSLWIVDSVQQSVTLCEKVDTEKDFTCRMKPLVVAPATPPR
jgi:hypothetical protein